MNISFNTDIIDDVISLYLFLSRKKVTITQLSNVVFGLDVYYLSKYKKPLIGGVYGTFFGLQININIFEHLDKLRTLYHECYLDFYEDSIGIKQCFTLEDLSKEELLDVTKFFISVLSTQNGESFDKYLDTKTNLSKINSDCCYLPITEYSLLTRDKRILLSSGNNAYPINLRNVLFSIFNNEEVAKDVYHSLTCDLKLSNLKLNKYSITIVINNNPYNFDNSRLNITKNSTVCIVNNNLKVDMKNYTPYSLLEIHKEKEVELEDLPF